MGRVVEIFATLPNSAATHQEIVAKAVEAGAPPWRCQMVAAAYEQHIGRRVTGHDGDGVFSLLANSTRVGSLDELFGRWTALVDGFDDVLGIPITRGPDTSATPKWRYWRCGLADGSRVVVNVSVKPEPPD